MTGGGSVFAGVNRVTHGFELHCDELDLPNNLEVNWGRGHRFHLEQLTSAICTEDPDIDQTPPGHSPFDTFIGEGIGRGNGVSGALISFTFVDGGKLPSPIRKGRLRAHLFLSFFRRFPGRGVVRGKVPARDCVSRLDERPVSLDRSPGAWHFARSL